MIETLPAKRQALETLLDSGPAMIHIDPRRDGVLVPADLCTGPVLRLKLSWRYSHPLHLDEQGVVQTLSFPSGSFRCAVPWESVFAMGPADAQPSWVWPSDLPGEMRDLLTAAAALPDTEEVDMPEGGPSAPLALLALDDYEPPAPPADEPGDDEPDNDDPPGTIRRGHLRLLK